MHFPNLLSKIDADVIGLTTITYTGIEIAYDIVVKTQFFVLPRWHTVKPKVIKRKSWINHLTNLVGVKSLYQIGGSK
jgi:hypothetical protein